ncbi:glutaredoxin family protein [Salinimonas chungwhensis]|uniref:glutaredoxin family protein n=1 Tax=Salinimonas chungwhensis TaxID=265425 RepID=UPI00039EBCA6|nr:glutaredoxin family protein [Salinimonas chungwhensis]
MLITLYTGPACSICDKALAMLRTLRPTPSVETVNVRTDSDLYHRYGARIPVIMRSDTQQELGWPFDQQMLKRFIE